METSTLDKLANTKDQRAYEQLYQSYLKQREHNKQINHILNRVEYALQQKDYDGVANELQNYQTIQEEGMKNLTQEWSKTQLQPTIPDATDYPMPQPITPPQDWDYVLRNIGKESPEAQKLAIGFGMNAAGIKVAPDANQFWKIATEDVNGYKKYLEQNGSIVESISQLPFDFKDTVRAKVRQQLYVNDAKGLIIRPDSALSQEIAASPEFHEFIKTHLSELLRGKVVSGSVVYTDWKNNLGLTLGYADIIDTYINKNGDIVSFVLDTYDFNPDENWMIEWGRNVQEHHLITCFYSITIVVVPKEDWLQLIGKPN